MENTKKFRTRLFGFHKLDVFHYIQELNDDFTARLRKKDTEIEQLRKEKIQQDLEMEDLKKEKDKIANALIHAEDKAKEMLEASSAEAEKRRRELEEQYGQEQQKLQAIRAEILSVRQAAMNAIRRMEADLSEMENETLQMEARIPDEENILPQQENAGNGTEGISAPPKSAVTPLPNSEKPHNRVNIIKLT